MSDNFFIVITGIAAGLLIGFNYGYELGVVDGWKKAEVYFKEEWKKWKKIK